MKNKVNLTILLAGGMGLLMMAIWGLSPASGQTTVPHIFVPDTPAKADEVNENFKAVTDAIDANAAALASASPSGAPAALPPGPRLMITSVEPDLSSLNNPTLLISGKLFSSTDSFTGSVFLYIPLQGKVGLNILGFDLARQEILVGLPVGIEATPGTMRLKVVSGTSAQYDEGAVSIGSVGPKGNTGDTGPAGETGAKGEQGAQGLLGLQGDSGAVGPAGPSGPKGNTGTTGAMSTMGPVGPKGNTGAGGPSGSKRKYRRNGDCGSSRTEGKHRCGRSVGVQRKYRRNRECGSSRSEGKYGCGRSVGVQRQYGCHGSDGGRAFWSERPGCLL